MSHIQVIILAAGKSSRLHPLTLHKPKSLLEFDSTPLLVRTIQQLHSVGLTSISVVVGHLQHTIKEALECFKSSIEYIYNDRYENDTNSLSLCLGLKGITKHAVLIIEADVVFSNACWPVIQKVCESKSSIWFTQGKFLPHQRGGIIKSDSNRKITDMKIVPAFDIQYQEYSKNLGVVYIGQNELNHYQAILEKKVIESTASYYMEHWMQHLSELYCEEINLFPHPAGSFNTLEELEYCRQYLNN
jgi:choline kinase